MKLARVIKVLLAATTAAALALAAAAPPALAAEGTGLLGHVDDLTITLLFFGVIAFFPMLVTVLSLIQSRLESRKERRRHDLKRFS